MIRAIIVDDEKPSREALHTYLLDFCPKVEVIALCESATSAARAIEAHNPDLVFLDIEMPNGSGFDLLEKFPHPTFRVIFVTAYSRYAVDAFRYSATDYLLKPLKVEELVEAVEKAERAIQSGIDHANLLQLMMHLKSDHFQPQNLVISNSSGFVVVRIDEIILCEAEGYCTRFHLTGRPVVTSSRNLKYYEDMLRDKGFIRVHHSFLANADMVCGYNNQGEVVLKGDLKCPLGSSYKSNFLRRFAKLK